MNPHIFLYVNVKGKDGKVGELGAGGQPSERAPYRRAGERLLSLGDSSR